jgi:hypothetical protein
MIWGVRSLLTRCVLDIVRSRLWFEEEDGKNQVLNQGKKKKKQDKPKCK